MIQMETLYENLARLNLGNLYSYVMKNNSANHLPYHNNFHIESVTKWALIGAEFYGLDNRIQRVIGAAALVHDFGHSGSGKNDDINIEIAINLFVEYFEFDGYETFSEFERDQIIELIKATRFPYLIECGDLSLPQQILRDSDILQGLFVQNYINGVVFAIATEAKISFDNMLAGQESFLKNIKYCTDWANNISKTQLPEILKKIRLINSFFSKYEINFK